MGSIGFSRSYKLLVLLIASDSAEAEYLYNIQILETVRCVGLLNLVFYDCDLQIQKECFVLIKKKKTICLVGIPGD